MLKDAAYEIGDDKMTKWHSLLLRRGRGFLLELRVQSVIATGVGGLAAVLRRAFHRVVTALEDVLGEKSEGKVTKQSSMKIQLL